MAVENGGITGSPKKDVLFSLDVAVSKSSVFEKPITIDERVWMRERAYPNMLGSGATMSVEGLTQLATAGDLEAMHHLAMKMIDRGIHIEDIHKLPSKKRSVFTYQLLAAQELGLVGPGWLRGQFQYSGPRNLIKGVAFDMLAQRLGEESLLPKLTQLEVSRHRAPPIITFIELKQAQEFAEQQWTRSQHQLIEGRSIRFDERRRLRINRRALQ
jgi:hypothetical protein